VRERGDFGVTEHLNAIAARSLLRVLAKIAGVFEREARLFGSCKMLLLPVFLLGRPVRLRGGVAQFGAVLMVLVMRSVVVTSGHKLETHNLFGFLAGFHPPSHARRRPILGQIRFLCCGSVGIFWPFTCCYGHMNKRQTRETKTYDGPVGKKRGLGPDSAGQSGDTQGLSDVAEAGSESVKELVEEGQSFEAEVISGVENAPDPDVAEVHTKQVREDDVPPEYQNEDKP
jgi:hypothetical protein